MNRTSLFRAMIILAAVTSSAPATAAGEPAGNEPERPALVSGAALDAGGHPVAGATAWLVTGEQDAFDPPLTTTADDSGRFEFPEVDERRLTGVGRRAATVVVRDEKGHIGWYRLSYARSQRWRCEVRLREVAEVRGRIVDGDGQPVAAVHLVCESFAEPRGTDGPTYSTSSADLFPKLATDYEARSSADGTFTLPRIPRGVRVNCRLSAAGMEDVRIAFEAGEPVVVRLGKPGSIAGSLEFPAGAEHKEPTVRVRISSRRKPKDDPGGLSLDYSHVTTAEASGEFRFDGLPPGSYSITPIAGQDLPWFGEATAPIEVRPGQQVTGVTVPLQACQQVRGRVVDRDTGQGIEFVEVDVMSWGSQDTRQVATDAEGRFAVWLRPGQVWVRVRRVPEKYVQPPLENAEPRNLRDGEWPTIRLARAIVIEGIVVDEAGNPVPLAELDIDTANRWLNRNMLPTRADRVGRFRIGQIDGSDVVTIEARSTDGVTGDATPFTASQATGGVRIVVSPKLACRIRGQVIDPDGAAVPFARVSLSTTRSVDLGGGSIGRRALAADDAVVGIDGSFDTGALWAGGHWELKIEADGYGPLTKELGSSQAGEVYDLGPLVLQPMRTFRGQVVDIAGRPVPDAELKVALRSPSRPRSFAARSDSQGQFFFPVEPSDIVSVWARGGAAASDGAVVALASRSRGPMTIVVSEDAAFRIACRVVDRDGQPVKDATVSLHRDYRVAQRNGRFGRGSGPFFTPRQASRALGNMSAGPDGSFQSDGLWAEDQYHLVVSAPDYQTAETPPLPAEAGRVRDLGNLVLRRGGLSVEGRVLDSEGQPISGATIINSGDAERALNVLTGNDGRFRLDGLFDGATYLLVRKEGYWPAGARGAAGDGGFEVRLTDRQEPRKVSGGPEAETDLADEQDFVRRWLPELWKLRNRLSTERSGRGGALPDEKPRMVKCMVSLDLDAALAWSTAEEGQFDDDVRLAAAERVVDKDIDQALMLADVPNSTAGYALRTMASQRIQEGANDDALRLLRAALDPRKTGYSRSVGYSEDQVRYGEAQVKAEIGRMAVAAGAQEWGRQLIEEAAAIVEQQENVYEAVQARAALAQALAGVSPPRAMHIWETLPTENYPFRSTLGEGQRIAAALAADDLPDARKILAAIERYEEREGTRSIPRSSDQVREAMACALARTSIDAAVALLDEKPFLTPDAKAGALASLASAVSKRDKERAWKLIDRALDTHIDNPVGANNGRLAAITRRGYFGNQPVGAAQIAVAAKAIGYPDMTSIVDRVLALRLTPQDSRQAGAFADSMIDTARLLALVDRRIAEELLRSIASQVPLIGTSYSSAKRGDWLVAWALVDLQRAKKMFVDELTAQQRQNVPEIIESGLLPMLELLATPPKDREIYLQRDFFNRS